MTEAPPPWHRYVAIGDSFTEGLVDPDPGRPGAYRGWSDRLAERLAARMDGDLRYANLAVRGRLLADVVGPQLEAALAMQPDLVSMVGGGNDILRPHVDLTLIAGRLEAAVVRIRATGADVLLATPTDTDRAGLFKVLRSRHAVHAANVFTIAQRHGCHVLNLWGLRALDDWRMWGEDRIHPSTPGHERITEAALAALGIRSGDDSWREPFPVRPALPRGEALAEHVAWARSHFGPWVGRRLRGESSGAALAAKRPRLVRVDPPDLAQHLSTQQSSEAGPGAGPR